MPTCVLQIIPPPPAKGIRLENYLVAKIRNCGQWDHVHSNHLQASTEVPKSDTESHKAVEGSTDRGGKGF